MPVGEAFFFAKLCVVSVACTALRYVLLSTHCLTNMPRDILFDISRLFPTSFLLERWCPMLPKLLALRACLEEGSNDLARSTAAAICWSHTMQTSGSSEMAIRSTTKRCGCSVNVSQHTFVRPYICLQRYRLGIPTVLTLPAHATTGLSWSTRRSSK